MLSGNQPLKPAIELDVADRLVAASSETGSAHGPTEGLVARPNASAAPLPPLTDAELLRPATPLHSPPPPLLVSVAERAGAVVVVGVGVGAAAAAEVEGVAVAATAAAEEEEEEAEEGAEAEAEAGAAEEVVVVVGARLASAASGLDYAHHITSRHVTHTTNQRVFTTALR